MLILQFSHYSQNVTNVRNVQNRKLLYGPSKSNLCIKSSDLAWKSKTRDFAQHDSKAHLEALSNQAVIDIDSIDSDNPLNATEYVQDIYKHFKHIEAHPSNCVDPSYVETQTDIRHKHRGILVDWLMKVHHRFELEDDTLFLAVNLIDRVLTKEPCPRSELQLVGATCLFLASKYEDIYAITVDDLVDMCAGACTSNDIFACEVAVLRALNYEVSFPTASTFLPRFLKAAEADDRTTSIAQYMLASTLLSHTLLRYRPSQLAAAAVFIARDHYSTTLHSNPWTPTLVYYTGYKSHEILPVAGALLKARKSLPKDLHYLNNIFKQEKYHSVSSLTYTPTV